MLIHNHTASRYTEIVHQYYWEILIFFCTFLFFITSIIWVISDKAPPSWDDGMYLNQVLTHTTAFRVGLQPFVTSILSVDRGRVPMGPLFAAPLSYLVGASELVAMISLNMFWFVLNWSLYTIGKIVFSKKVGFVSVIFTGLLPVIQWVTHIYLVDFYLVTFVVLTIAILLLNIKNNNKYYWLLGMILGFGVLVKITFLIFIIFPLLIYAAYFIRFYKTNKLAILKLFLSFGIGFLIASSYLIINFKPLVEQTRWLNSPKLATMYGMQNPFSVQALIHFIRLQFNYYMGAIIGLGGLGGAVFYFYKTKNIVYPTKYFLCILFSWFFPALLIFGLGYIQDVRYFMPALPVASLFAAYLFTSNQKIPLWLIIVALPIIFSFSPQSLRIFGYALPDDRDWRTAETISSLRNVLQLYSPNNNQLLFLGGTQQYHTALFRYFSRLQDDELFFNTLPYYSQPDMTAEDAIEYIIEKKFPAIIYKTGVAWPEFSSKNDVEIVRFLDAHPDQYTKHSLGIILPDNNEYFVYVINKCQLVDKIDLDETKLLKNTYTFGSFISLKTATLSTSKATNELNLYWEQLSKLPGNYTKFVHLINSSDEIIAQKDEPYSNECLVNTTENMMFKEIIPLHASEMENTQSINIGLYISPDITSALLITPSDGVDWNGRRLSITLPVD